MKKYSFNRRSVRVNIISAIVIAILGLTITVFIVLRASDLPSTLLGVAAPVFMVWVAVSGIIQLTRGYHIEDDGIAIHKVLRDGKRESLTWNEITNVRVRRYRNQVILTYHEGGRRMLIDTQLNNFAELFSKMQERFPNLHYKLK